MRRASMTIERRIDELLTEHGAVKVGFATLETLSDGPPSADLEHVLPGARSAVSFALAFDRDKIRAYLSKSDAQPHTTEQQTLYTDLYVLSEKVAVLLRENGHRAVAVIPNGEYRKDRPSPGYLWDSHPPLSHRYVAVASGVGSFGWSGNVGIAGYGANILLGTCVTTAELTPTPPIPVDAGYCDSCKACVAACPSEMFSKDESMTQTLGGVTYTHATRNSITRCLMCCSGLTGLHKSGKWGSWSPGRFTIPEDEEQLREQTLRAASLKKQRPDAPLETGDAVVFDDDHPFHGMQMVPTCGNCQLVCFGDHDETMENLRTLRRSGCVVQQPDGSLDVLPPEESARVFAELVPAHKAKYE